MPIQPADQGLFLPDPDIPCTLKALMQADVDHGMNRVKKLQKWPNQLHVF